MSVELNENMLVILDSNHTKQHVLKELNAYSSLVTKGSYIVATDGSMKELHDVPRGNPEWIWDNPTYAALEFADDNPEFVVEQPEWSFNES
jgi:cephalosporin hydroxylase